MRYWIQSCTSALSQFVFHEVPFAPFCVFGWPNHDAAAETIPFSANFMLLAARFMTLTRNFMPLTTNFMTLPANFMRVTANFMPVTWPIPSPLTRDFIALTPKINARAD